MIRIKNKTLLIFIFFDILSLVCAILLIAIPVMGHQRIADEPNFAFVAQAVLLDECPLTAAIVNGVFMLITFAISVPGIMMKKNRLLLTIHAWLLIFNAVFTLGVGLAIWFSTLQTRANLAPIWASQDVLVQSMLQQKFKCCGYKDTTTFRQDALCTSADVAAALGPCVIPFSAYANNFLDVIFTTMFGFCAVDGLLLLSGMCVLKNRAEQARYQLIDEKRTAYTNYSYSRF